MLEQGLVRLVQGNGAVSAIALTGGYFAELPKDLALPSWTYGGVSLVVDYVLAGPSGFRMRRVQIDCFGNNGAEALSLANAIDSVLNGYHGTLTDTDSTVVQGCFLDNSIDFFDDVRRSYRRMLDYKIEYST